MPQINGMAVRKFRFMQDLDRNQLAELLGTNAEVISSWEINNNLDAEEQYAFAVVAEKRGITREMLLDWSK